MFALTPRFEPACRSLCRDRIRAAERLSIGRLIKRSVYATVAVDRTRRPSVDRPGSRPRPARSGWLAAARPVPVPRTVKGDQPMQDTLGAMFVRAGERYADRLAVKSSNGRRTYAEVLQNGARVANVLREAGLRPG